MPTGPTKKKGSITAPASGSPAGRRITNELAIDLGTVIPPDPDKGELEPESLKPRADRRTGIWVDPSTPIPDDPDELKAMQDAQARERRRGIK